MISKERTVLRRTIAAFLLVFVISSTPVFAEVDTRTDNSTGGVIQTEEQNGTDEGGQVQEDPQTVEPVSQAEPKPVTKQKKKAVAKIIKKGKYYYYKYPSGKIRKKAGFVTVGKKKYYVQKGGRIKTSASFKVSKKYYRANKYGVIKTGVYKWGRYYYFSNSKGVLKKSEGFITWKNHEYYVQKGGKILTGTGFVIKNIAYVASSKGRVTKVDLSNDNNAVIRVARKQVGIMTGKTYWVWYYKSVFLDTDRTPWCGAFVAWVYNKAGMYNKISVAKRYGPLGYVPVYSRFADRNNKWIKREKARAGDIIVFGRNRHVGLVEGVYGRYIVTIEGNAGPTAVFGCGKPGAVVRKIYKLNDKDIKGVIRVFKHKAKRSAK